MRLKDFLSYDNIVIQCHDNPDADAIASGYGVYYYLKKMGKEPRLVYSGKFKVQKSNLVLMVENLQIPLEYVPTISETDLLITVDCQYGEGNVSPLPAKTVAVIDHHQPGKNPPKMNEIHPHLGSCATLIGKLLKQENIDFNEDEKLATALYYGLLTDTNNFAEMFHPLDKNLREDAHVRQSMIRLFRNANLSLEELEIAGEALQHYEYDEKHHYAIVEARPCDPNILGLISDMLLEVDVVESGLVYCVLDAGAKLSVRSCVREVKASELAAYLTHQVGNGGGHVDKAGGFIQKSRLEETELYQAITEKNEHARIRAYLRSCMERYFVTTEIIEANTYKADLTGMKLYHKVPFDLGYVKGTDVVPAGTKVIIRTIEGDIDISIEKDTYIMIGIHGEIYPITEDKVRSSYFLTNEDYNEELEYFPEIKEAREGNRISLLPFAKKCSSTGTSAIYAKKLEHRVKVFTNWDEDNYYLGKVGDYLAVREDDLLDVYVIADDIFQKTYQ